MTTMSQKPQSDDTVGGVCRAMTDAGLDALAERLIAHKHWGMTEEAAAAITTLRAQLADANARADRAEFNAAQLAVMVGEDAVEQIEAAVAAQIERDAGICDEMNRSIWEYDAYECALSIRAQPHDRTALDAAIRDAKVEAWKVAADLPKRTEKLGGQNYAYVRVEEILALIEREATHD